MSAIWFLEGCEQYWFLLEGEWSGCSVKDSPWNQLRCTRFTSHYSISPWGSQIFNFIFASQDTLLQILAEYFCQSFKIHFRKFWVNNPTWQNYQWEIFLNTIPSLGSELLGCCVYASWKASSYIKLGKGRQRNFLSLLMFILTHFVVVLLAVGLYLKPIKGTTFMLFLNSVPCLIKHGINSFSMLCFRSIIKEPLSPVKYVSFVYSWCFSSLVEQCK